MSHGLTSICQLPTRRPQSDCHWCLTNQQFSFSKPDDLDGRFRVRARHRWPLDYQAEGLFFGQPPDLQLQTADSLEACAIIFDGVSSALEFGTIAGPGNEDLEDGTCADALTSECVAQWTAQVEALVSQNNGTLNCSELGQALQGNPPASCENLDGSWGKITTQGKYP